MPPRLPDFAVIPPWSEPTNAVMNRLILKRAPRETTVPRSGAALPGHDAGRDSARHYAAVGLFGVAALSVFGVAVAAYTFRDAERLGPTRAGFGLDAAGVATMGFATTGVAADAPTLRPSLGGTGGDSITVFDSATGQNEVMAGPGALDTADAASFTGGTPAAPLTP